MKKNLKKTLARSLIAVFCAVSMILPVDAGNIAEAEAMATVIITSDSTVSPETLAERVSLVTGERPIYIYDLLEGFSMSVKTSDIYKLAPISGVAGVYESQRHVKASSDSIIPLNNRAQKNEIITMRDSIDSELRGEGTVVAVLDNCFDVTHKIFRLSDDTEPALDEDYENSIEKTLSIANYESYTSRDAYVSRKIPFAFDYADYDFDVLGTDSHGTHVAGIIAANNIGGYSDGFDGIAPEAQLLLMKVSSDSSDYLEDYAILAAINDAVVLGADVINLSFGETAGSLTYLEGIDYTSVFRTASNAGTSVYAAAGNEYKTGQGSGYYDEYGITEPLASSPDYSTVNTPASFSGAMSVASSGSPTVVLSKYLKVGDAMISYVDDSEGLFSTAMKGKTYGYEVIPGYGEPSDYENIDVEGKLAVIQRGSISFADKLYNAEAAGAVGAVIWNNKPGEGFITMLVEPGQIPSASITYENAYKLTGTDSGSVAVINRSPTSVETDDTGISWYSSWGATELLTLKPDVTGIGGEVYSSISGGSFAIMSGTSMATPYLSGIDALMHQAQREGLFGDADFGATEKLTRIKNLITSSATPLIDSESGIEYSPRAQGAGLADADAAINCRTIASSNKTGLCKIELYDDIGESFKLYVNLKNLSDTEKTYVISATSQTDGYEYIIEAGQYFTTASPTALVQTSMKLEGASGELNKYSSAFSDGATVTLKAGAEVDLVITVKLYAKEIDALKKIFTNGMYIEGFVYFTETAGDGDAVSIPYMGFLGDFGAVPIFDAGGKYFETRLVTYIESDPEDIGLLLGVNSFTDDDSYNPSTAAISPNGDGYADTIGLALGFLRNVGQVTAEVYSEDGELLYSVDGGVGWKKCIYDVELYMSGLAYDIWDVTDPDNTKFTLPDGDYYMIVAAASSYNADYIQTLRLDFSVDTVFPELSGYEIIEEDGRRYLVTYASDDRYIQCVRAYEGLERSLYEDYYSDPDKYDLYDSYAAFPGDEAEAEAVARFDITDYDQSYIYLDIVDYACNLKTVKINLD